MRVEVRANGSPLEMEVDSGAVYSVINDRTMRKLRISKRALRPSGRHLRAYNNKELRVLGELTVTVEFKGQEHRLRLVLVKGASVGLIGRDWFKSLGISLSGVNSVCEPSRTGSKGTTALLKKYSSVFEPGLGTSKGPPVRIEVNPAAPPRFLKPRQVQFALRPKVDEALDRLRYMEELLHGIDGVLVFLDDILIGGRDEAQHHARLQEVLKRIHEDGLRLKFDKCQFCVEEVRYLGFSVNSAGVQPTVEKVRAIHEAPEPTCKKELQVFLGALNFYKKFLKGATHALEPLYRLLDKGRQWRWTGAEADAFRQAKDLLQSSHVLVHYDVNRPLVLACDAFPYGLGAALSHHGWPEGKLPEEFAAFVSRKHELSVYQGCLLWGSRVVIPEPARPYVMDILHTAHQRIVKMKGLARGAVWWPGIDGDVEQKSSVQQKQEQVMQRRNQAVRLFEVVDRVFVRNYLYGPKWLPGIVDSVTGPVSYLVVTKDGRRWRRHVDQLRSRSASYALDSSTYRMCEEEEPLVASPAECSESGITSSPEDPGRRDQREIREEAATPSTEPGSCGEDSKVSASLQVQRPQRQRSRPAYLKDFVT
ncbi:uncharacterized protein LOC142584548 [Dermacentor variabilis]|uniref:uncharacterized protein LOC142584548 n=1 Tax=Dermacentor variabilis TaxID=34621 RepID=UPI003F5C7D1A